MVPIVHILDTRDDTGYNTTSLPSPTSQLRCARGGTDKEQPEHTFLISSMNYSPRPGMPSYALGWELTVVMGGGWSIALAMYISGLNL